MSECIHFEKCSNGPETVDLAGDSCVKDEKGYEKCGPIEAYDLAFWDYKIDLMGLDDTNPIKGYLTDINGVDYPIRQNNFLDDNKIEVHFIDVFLSRVQSGMFRNAEAWLKLEKKYEDKNIFTVKVDDCEIAECEPINSFDYYSSKLEPEIRKTIESVSC